MSHFVCNRCGAVFSEEDAATESFFHDEVRPTFTEKFMACPRCLQVDYEDAAYCYRCKKPMRYSDLKGGYYCRDCVREITRANPVLEHKYALEMIDDYAEYLHEIRARTNEDEKDYKLC